MHNHYRDEKWLINNIEHFRNQINNLFGCTLHVTVYPSEPFLMIGVAEDGVEVDSIDGTLLRVLSQKMNFKIKINKPEGQWGVIYENGTSTGEFEFWQCSKKFNN